MVAEQYRQYVAAMNPEDPTREPFAAQPFTVTTERAGITIEAMRRMSSYSEFDPPFQFKSGRGGRIQIRFVAELPHELTAEDRALIVQNFCEHISSLEERRLPDGTVEKVGLMYTAVIHAPDAPNDSRNYHLHVVAHDRPAKYLDDLGMWDFEVEETYLTTSREERIKFSRRQNKIGEVSQGTSKTGKEVWRRLHSGSPLEVHPDQQCRP